MSTFLFLLFGAAILTILRGYDLVTERLAAGRELARRAHMPEVSIVLPVVDEERHLEARLRDLAATDYPPELLELFVVDNGSADRTPEIARAFAAAAPFSTRVLTSARGKIPAIDAGIAAASKPWILVTDADVRAEPDALRRLAAAVGEGVGAASATPVLGLPGEPARLAFTASKRRFHDRDFRLRALESRLHSACSLDGKFMLFRKDLAPGGIPPDALVDDYELTFMVVGAGERCVLAEDAVVYEGYPETAEDDLRQIRRRTAQGLLMAFRHARFAFNPRYGAFGLWTFPFRRFLIYYLPFLLAYEALWLLARAPHLAIAGGALGAGWMLATGRTYPFVLYTGMLLGWLDLALGRSRDFGRGGVWSRTDGSA